MTRQERLEWFKRFNQRLGRLAVETDDLVTQVRMEEEAFARIKKAAREYICACLKTQDKLLEDEALLTRVERDIDRLANRTPNGILLPKQEFTREFNAYQSAVAAWYKQLGIDSMIDQVFNPIILRIVKPMASTPAAVAPATGKNRPYDSTKLHVDLWNGDPADNINLLIPLWGDLERTTVEFFRPPDDFEERFLRVIDDYSEGEKQMGVCEPYPIRFKHGHALFCDAVVLHQTVKKPGGRVRISIQFEQRRKTSPEIKAKMDRLAMPERLRTYLDLKTWSQLGTTQFMKFKDTNADAQRGVIASRPYLDDTYSLVDSLEEACFQASTNVSAS